MEPCRVCKCDFFPSPSQIREKQWICKVCRRWEHKQRMEKKRNPQHYMHVAEGICVPIGKAKKKTWIAPK